MRSSLANHEGSKPTPTLWFENSLPCGRPPSSSAAPGTPSSSSLKAPPAAFATPQLTQVLDVCQSERLAGESCGTLLSELFFLGPFVPLCGRFAEPPHGLAVVLLTTVRDAEVALGAGMPLIISLPEPPHGLAVVLLHTVA
jgi:hypothetical protein